VLGDLVVLLAPQLLGLLKAATVAAVSSSVLDTQGVSRPEARGSRALKLAMEARYPFPTHGGGSTTVVR
jgi:hypothetical protein